MPSKRESIVSAFVAMARGRSPLATDRVYTAVAGAEASRVARASAGGGRPSRRAMAAMTDACSAARPGRSGARATARSRCRSHAATASRSAGATSPLSRP